MEGEKRGGRKQKNYCKWGSNAAGPAATINTDLVQHTFTSQIATQLDKTAFCAVESSRKEGTLLTLSNMDALQTYSCTEGHNGHVVQSSKVVSSVQRVNLISPVSRQPSALTAVR